MNEESLCDTCHSPGHCCKGFFLNTVGMTPQTHWEDEWQVTARKIPGGNLNFIPIEFIPIKNPSPDAEGRVYGNVKYGCSELLPNGRCGIYETRPQLCRDYNPGDDPLCVYHVPKTKNGEVK